MKRNFFRLTCFFIILFSVDAHSQYSIYSTVEPADNNPATADYDLDGYKLICDDDQDTYLQCSSDDVMSIGIGGTERINASDSRIDFTNTGGTIRLGDGTNVADLQVTADGTIALKNASGTSTTTVKPTGEYIFSSGTRMISTSDGTLSIQENDSSSLFTISPPNGAIIAGTSLYIGTGFGFDLTLRPGSGFNDVIIDANSLRLPPQESDSVSEPVTCDASHTGYMQYVDDTNDSSSAAVCICVATTDSTYDWALDGSRVAGVWTACPFF